MIEVPLKRRLTQLRIASVIMIVVVFITIYSAFQLSSIRSTTEDAKMAMTSALLNLFWANEAADNARTNQAIAETKIAYLHATATQIPLEFPQAGRLIWEMSVREDIATKFTSAILRWKANPNRLVAYIKKLVNQHPTEPLTYRILGLVYHIQGEVDLAVNNYTQAITLDPQYIDAYYNRGIAYAQQEKYELAIADLTQVIDLDSQYVDAYIYRAIVFHAQGKYDLAIADYNQAIMLDPRNVVAYNNRGITYSFQQRDDLAIADYNHAIMLDSQFAPPYYNRGSVYYDQGNYDLAVKNYTQAIFLDANYADAYRGRAMAYNNQGNLESALEDMEQYQLLTSSLSIVPRMFIAEIQLTLTAIATPTN